MLKRQPGPFGKTLGKTTGWVLRQELRDLGVAQIAGATYRGIVPDGLDIEVDGEPRVIEADTIVVCAGQIPEASLAGELRERGRSVHVIGGARLASELDAQRAVDDGVRLGLAL